MYGEQYAIRSSRLIVDGRVAPGLITIRGQKILHVHLDDSPSSPHAHTHPAPQSAYTLDVGNLVVMPGLVDTHVHVNEPGRTDWEGFTTAGRAAAAGGITTIVVMPLNCTPAATNVAALMGEAEAAAGKCLVDYGFWGGLVPGNQHELESMWNAGALGFKAFMVDSGVDDFPAATWGDLCGAAEFLSLVKGPLLVHAEDSGVIASKASAWQASSSPRSYKKYVLSRPAIAERLAVEEIDFVAWKRHCHVHIVHVAALEALSLIETKQREGVNISAETCPHYLTFAEEEIRDGATQYKCAPPIRDQRHREALWEGLSNGILTMVVSDHSPCPPAMKLLDTGDFSRAWGGISSLQLGLPITWTGASARDFPLTDIATWMCENPAKLAGINHLKGRIAPGLHADLVIFDPDESWTVHGSALHHRHKLTPYDGMTLRGVVKRTILRGRTIYDAALPNPFPLDPIGQWLKRGT